MSDEKKLTLGSRTPLGLKKTVEAGQVKQSFSHGRSKSVVVEVKKRRVLKRQDEEAEATPPAAPVAPTPAAPAPPPAARPATPAPQSRSGGRIDDRMARQEALQAQLRQAEEERMRAAEELRKRSEEHAQASALAEREAREANRAVNEQPEPAAPERPATAKPQGKAAPRPGPAEEVIMGPPPEEGELTKGKTAQRARTKEDDERDQASKRKPEPEKPSRGRLGDQRRQSGKLTVLKALDEDESGRTRSLAALRRAREKERRAQQQGGPQAKQARDVVVPDVIAVSDLANRMAERSGDVIKALFKMGVVATPAQNIDQDTAELIVSEFGHNIKRVSESDVEIGLFDAVDEEGDLQPRAPVVTVMGHVDHGKTSLLDALRGTDVVRGEAGGITQHIGAYQVTLKSGDRITFLDTPGHAAFTEMRARGANITDIVILVVAADDGLMPQTVEAINHAKAAKVPMIVAINKIDKDGADANKVRQALLQHEVIVEELSGDVQDAEVSATKNIGLDKLAEKIVLQAELLELKASANRAAEGTVVEARLDKGRGPLATVLVRRGTLNVGDIFVTGANWGKVRALVNDRGQRVDTAGPSEPVEVLGLDGVPSAGDDFVVVESEGRAREIAKYRADLILKKRTAAAPTTLENMFSAIRDGEVKEIALVVKADVHGSVEAISQAIERLSTPEIKARVIHSAVGGITESDITLARASNAPIIGFNVRANAKAREAATQDGVSLKYYDIIYGLIDDVKAMMAGELGPEIIETVVGRADVLDVFQAGKSGKAAGCRVTEGIIRQKLSARVMRDDVIVYKGKISNLRRFKDDVAEVRSGLECGMTLENFQDIKQGDIIEVFETEERERVF